MDGLRQVSSPISLLPAYGRVYDSPEAALNDWKSGKDFKIVGGSYCSIRDKGVLKSQSSTGYIMWNRADAVRIF
jgi:hypothetical protein